MVNRESRQSIIKELGNFNCICEYCENGKKEDINSLETFQKWNGEAYQIRASFAPGFFEERPSFRLDHLQKMHEVKFDAPGFLHEAEKEMGKNIFF